MTAAAFFIQAALAGAALLAAPRIAKAPAVVWRSVCLLALALLLAWPLMRVFPVLPIRALGAPFVACVELTGLFVPAVLLLAVAARHVPKPSDRRALYLLIPVACAYFIKAGWWMFMPPPTLEAPTEIDPSGVARQTTGYTCVAASLVTVLRARGLDVTEQEMVDLTRTERGGGATDSRALWALERRLQGTALRARYLDLDYQALAAAPKPCLVQLDFSYFFSHMTVVLEATPSRVVLGDPLTGVRELTPPAFHAQWKGQAIVVEPAPPPLGQP